MTFPRPGSFAVKACSSTFVGPDNVPAQLRVTYVPGQMVIHL
jgi:hypothetical protein